MTSEPRPALELAARALCRHDRNPEETMFDGKPLWVSYLGAAQAVLDALDFKEVERRPGYRTSTTQFD